MKQKYLLRGLMTCLMLALANIPVCADENEIFVSYATMTNDDGTTEQIPMRFKVLNDKTSCAV